ncbi:MAG: single-stranded DNA-binding protein [Erysipelotrichaceae bacterium]|nr:single-stranded DNA-binding protein [Erysipelotrichaceae bacterium]
MINRVVLVGRLTKDIELRKTTSNISTCTFTLACNRKFSSSANNQGPTADFINCVAWRQSADFLAQYASKGAIVGVEGRITTRSYDGQNGKVYVTEVTCDSVQLIGGSKASASTGMSQNRTFTPSAEAGFSENSLDDDFSNTPSLDISSDDLPFY